jgi:YD repeat-containing protein
MLAVLESRFVDDIDIYNKKIYFDTAAGYLNNGGMPLVREVKENKTSDKNNNIVFEKYDMEGRLLQFKQADNVSTSVIWGYNNEYPIAKLENIAYNEIPSDLIAQLKTKSNGFIQSELMDAFTNLRNSPVLNKGLITTYTYAPLIGVTSITDPKGYTTYYEYDEFNRLRSSRDAAGNIIAEKKYNYKQ